MSVRDLVSLATDVPLFFKASCLNHFQKISCLIFQAYAKHQSLLAFDFKLVCSIFPPCVIRTCNRYGTDEQVSYLVLPIYPFGPKFDKAPFAQNMVNDIHI